MLMTISFIVAMTCDGTAGCPMRWNRFLKLKHLISPGELRGPDGTREGPFSFNSCSFSHASTWQKSAPDDLSVGLQHRKGHFWMQRFLTGLAGLVYFN